MPSYTRGQKRDQLTYVKVYAGMYYAWKTKDLSAIAGVSKNDLTAIGHEKSGLAANALVIIGAKAPQPPRVSKKITNNQGTGTGQQSISTFCAYDKIATAGQNGWNITKTRKAVSITAANKNKVKQTAIAELTGGILYAFPLDKADFGTFASQLGLESATKISTQAEREKLVSGSDKPRPGVAKKELDNGSTFSTFFSTTKMEDVVKNGFSIISEEILLIVPSAPNNNGGGG